MPYLILAGLIFAGSAILIYLYNNAGNFTRKRPERKEKPDIIYLSTEYKGEDENIK